MNGELPSGWKEVRLGDIVSLNPRHPASLDDSLSVTFTPMPALSENSHRFKRSEERPLRQVKKGYTHFADGDVLLAKITPCMENGKAAVATGLANGIGCGTTELHVLRPKEGVNSWYLYHYLHQKSFRREATANFTGTAGQLRVPVAFMAGAEIPLPPTAEQARIVAKLEKLLEKVDDCRERLAKIPVILKRFRQSVLSAACSGRLTADFEENQRRTGWSSGELVDFGKVSGGVTKNARRGSLPLQAPYISVGNVYENDLRLDDVGVIGVSKMEFDRTLLRTDDLLFVEGNGSIDQVGRVALWNDQIQPCLHQNHIIKFRSGINLSPKFALFWMMSPQGRDSLTEAAVSTAGLYNLSITKIEKLPIRCPPLPEQHEIVRRVEGLFALADKIEDRYKKAKEQVDKLTQSILAKAFRGELVPQDPNDEPASELLKRIKTETLANIKSRTRVRKPKT